MTGYAIRYRPGTDLGRRFPGPSHLTLPTREAAEEIWRRCPNANDMEVIEVPETRRFCDPPAPGDPEPETRRFCDPSDDDVDHPEDDTP